MEWALSCSDRRCSRQLTLSPLAMPAIMTQFNGHMMELEVDCFDTVQEVKHKILNAYFRQIERSDEQMYLEEFEVVSHGFKASPPPRAFRNRS